MTSQITASNPAANGVGAASAFRLPPNSVSDRTPTATAIPSRIVGLANAAARSLPDSALTEKSSLKTEAAANANANQDDKALKSVQTSNEGQFTVNWNLNKPEDKDKDKDKYKAVIGNS